MIYITFLLSLQLDSAIFDPFSEVKNDPVEVAVDCKDDGDYYELVEEDVTGNAKNPNDAKKLLNQILDY